MKQQQQPTSFSAGELRCILVNLLDSYDRSLCAEIVHTVVRQISVTVASPRETHLVYDNCKNMEVMVKQRGWTEF